MCEQTEIDYLDGEVVWVKLGSCWWPGEVVAKDKLPPDVLPSFRKPPIACVKFFQEDAYEFVKNINNIYKYNCSRKNEFINKGLYLFRTKHGHMEKFPDDVIRAETAIGGDIEILTRDEFQETKKESYAGLFGNPKKTPGSVKKGKSGRGRPSAESPSTITPRRLIKEKTDYKVHILVQGSKCASLDTPLSDEKPSTSAVDDALTEEKPQEQNTVQEDKESNDDTNNTDNKETPKSNPSPVPSTPLRSTPPSTAPSSSGIYSCHACSFTTTRLNVLILHNKTHSVSFIPYTPSPVRKKPKSPVKSTPNSSKTPKPRKPRKEKTEKPPKKAQGKKRASEEKTDTVEKKSKTDEEIKSKLLADWDDVDEDSNDESTMVSAQSPEVPIGAESPAVPTPAELPSAQVPAEMSPVPDKKSNSSPSTEKPESSSDSKYEFCEDEDWPEETDFGRKIPRVKNPIRTEDSKNVGIDEDEVAREVAELLNKTVVPELPTVPEPLRIEENFPEPPIVKSPDKSQDKSLEKPAEKSATEAPPTKAIFKTKTFFRSRHSRSQDAIGKYVAEQLNAVERMDISESDMNGSEAVSSPETRDSPPIEPVKVARLAPKIQLKKMKAEAAQLREKEKLGFEQAFEPLAYNQISMPRNEMHKEISILEDNVKEDEKSQLKSVQGVLYPTQEIKPLNEDFHHKFETKVLQESLTDKDILMEEDTSEIVKEAQNSEDEIILKSKIDEEIPQAETLGISSSNLMETPNYEEESAKYEENTAQCPEKTKKLIENLTELEKEISNNGEVVIHSPVYDNEFSEYEKVAPHYSEPEQKSKVENDISDKEGEPPVLHEEPVSENDTTKYEVLTTKADDKLETSQSVKLTSEIDQDLNSNQEPEVEEPKHGSKVDKSSLLDKEETLTETLSEQTTNVKSQEQMDHYMNESTASAVDALLSVSRETDREPRAVTNDLPEDLFEEDKDTDSIEHIIDDNNVFEEKIEMQNSCLAENGLTEQMETEEIHDHVETVPEIQEQSQNNLDETSTPEVLHSEEICEKNIDNAMDGNNSFGQKDNKDESVGENVPSESDLQVAEALINLPATAIQNPTPTEHKDSLVMPFSFDPESKTEGIDPASENILIHDTEIGYQENEVETEIVDHVPESAADSENLNTRFETEQEKSENLNAAQSLVQMSESVEHTINVVEPMDTKDVTEPNSFATTQNNGIDTSLNSVEQNIAILTDESNIVKETPKTSILSQSSSKLLKILEEPYKPKIISKTSPTKQLVQGNEKILNFDVAKSVFNKNKTPKQKIIIRRNPTTNKTVLNKVTEVSGSDKIILSRSSTQAQEGSSVQRFTIQTSPDTPSDANTIIIQQKIRKITKPAVIQPKLQKIKPQTSLVSPVGEVQAINKTQNNEDAMFDINSMPIVLSEDLLTPESIEKMPVVMSDGNNIISPSPSTPKVIKPKQNVVEQEKVVITSSPHKQQEVKTLLLNPAGEATKSATPNILSKSSKMRTAKPMLVIDKATGKQKIIMTKSEPATKELKQTQPTIIQPASTASKTEKFIILPTQSSPRPTRTQKIVIDPQTGKAHMFVAKASDSPLSAAENKPVSAKLMPSNTEAAAPGNTVMIITNAQGAQSRIVLTPRHEKILFPNKQQSNFPQLKTITHRITPASPVQRTVVTTMASTKPAAIAPVRPPARIVPKQNKSAIITSKGQLIVGGRVATTAQNIAPMPELRPVQPKRIVTSEPKKLTHTVQKTNSEPIIFLQQKSGAVMQLTAAQFEHLQRTGQIVQKNPTPVQERVVGQKARPATEPGVSAKRGRKPVTVSPTPAKKPKQEVAIAPAPSLLPVPAQPPAPAAPSSVASAAAPPSLVTVQPASFVPAASHVVSVASGSAATDYSDFENFEELLPSTAIARQVPEVAVAQPEPAPTTAPDPPAAISDQILAVPGEHFGALAGTFYLCVEENGTYTPIDNRPLVLENDQLVPMEVPPPAPERRDILEAALANSDVFRADAARDDAPDFRDLNANVSVHCRVAETSTTLNQPIMTPVELPSSAGERAVPASLDAGLAVIGVTPHTVPTSLELPITVTDPRIAPRAPDPLAAAAAPLGAEFDAGPISMPLLTDEEAVGKSMPILTEEAGGADGAGWRRGARLAPAPSSAPLATGS